MSIAKIPFILVRECGVDMIFACDRWDHASGGSTDEGAVKIKTGFEALLFRGMNKSNMGPLFRRSEALR